VFAGVVVLALALVFGVRLFGNRSVTILTASPATTDIHGANATGDAAVVAERLRISGVGRSSVKAAGGKLLISVRGKADRKMIWGLVGERGQFDLRLVADEERAHDALKAIDAATRQPGTFLGYVTTCGGDFAVTVKDYPKLGTAYEQAGAAVRGEYSLMAGHPEVYESRDVMRLYVVRTEPELVPAPVKEARAERYQGSAVGLDGFWSVNLQLARTDAPKFAQVTGRNIGRRIAMVLDGVVLSAPVVQTRIPDGNAMIMVADRQAAERLAAILRSGPTSIQWSLE
jgi:preprotein translocase subunit SecD